MQGRRDTHQEHVHCHREEGAALHEIDSGSRVLTYAYTSRNQLYSVAETVGTVYYTYNENGSETGITNQNSSTVAKVLDRAGGLTSVTNKNSSGTTLSSFSYVLDSDGRRSSCTEASGDVVSFGYDWGSRLTSESRTGSNAYSVSYTLNAGGNRTSQTAGTDVTAFTYSNDDELTATSSTTGGFINSYSYNANGEQTNRTLSGTSNTLAFDYEGQLSSITQGIHFQLRCSIEVFSISSEMFKLLYSMTADPIKFSGEATVRFESCLGGRQ